MVDTVIRSRIDKNVKVKATHLFEHMGLSMSDAIRLFLYQSIAEQGLPFQIRLPNAKTVAVLRDIRKNRQKLKKTSLKQLEKDWYK